MQFISQLYVCPHTNATTQTLPPCVNIVVYLSLYTILYNNYSYYLRCELFSTRTNLNTPYRTPHHRTSLTICVWCINKYKTYVFILFLFCFVLLMVVARAKHTSRKSRTFAEYMYRIAFIKYEIYERDMRRKCSRIWWRVFVWRHLSAPTGILKITGIISPI